MKTQIKKIIKKIPYAKTLHTKFKDTFALYANQSYSQEGEDLILQRIFERQKDGFYVDVGAHHPFRFSNTYLFYKRGWKGINIDAMPQSMKPFNHYRPRDINLESPIGREDEILEYFSFNEPAVNTFDSRVAKRTIDQKVYQLLQIHKMTTSSLKKILFSHLPKNQKIDFMSVDVEGLDLQVLQSNDWDLFRPKILLVEALGGGGLEEILASPLYLYLSSQGYSLFAKTFNTLFFRDTRSVDD